MSLKAALVKKEVKGEVAIFTCNKNGGLILFYCFPWQKKIMLLSCLQIISSFIYLIILNTYFDFSQIFSVTQRAKRTKAKNHHTTCLLELLKSSLANWTVTFTMWLFLTLMLRLSYYSVDSIVYYIFKANWWSVQNNLNFLTAAQILVKNKTIALFPLPLKATCQFLEFLCFSPWSI